MEFELEIERAGERYRARVNQAPVGQGARSDFDLPSEEELEDLERERPRNFRIDAPRQGSSAKSFGQRLFESIFTGPVLEAWRASLALTQGQLLLRLRLDDDARLLRVPWEILFDPRQREFVAIEMRVVRSLDLPVRARPLSGPPPLRILVVLSSPPDVAPLATKQEWAVLDEALGGEVELKLVDPKLEDVDRALKSGEWDVLHFVGHGSTDDEGGILILEDCHGDARAVDHLHLATFLGHRSLRLVVLNACEGSRPGKRDAFSGVAQALIRKGVPAVVAMQQPISDAAAITFAKVFYGALAEQRTVGAALWRARESLFRDHEAEWAVPVLYLNGPDESLLVPDKKGNGWPKVAAAVVVGVLLLAFLIWLSVRPSDEPPGEPNGPKPPRGDEENPKECHSPEGLNLAMVEIHRGAFELGDKGSKDTRPVHQVEIMESFCLGRYEVTREQWSRVMGEPLPLESERHLPAEGVTFEEAVQFLVRLNQMDTSSHYRLPTEAEWEKAARAGTRTLYSFGDDEERLSLHGNCRGADKFARVAPVGQFAANPAGLFDMYGNVSEWVSDWYGDYPDEAVVDPLGPPKGTKRIRRGGSWDSGTKACSSAARSAVRPDRKDQQNGFRIVREIR